MQKKSAFTLVELIVSVTIISVLSTVWFMWFTSYLSSVRDTNRTAQLVEVYDALVQKNLTDTLPMPDDYIEIVSNGKIIAYQWYAWEKVLLSLWLSDSIIDPKDNTYYSYYLTKNKKYSEVMAFLEEEVDGKDMSFFETIAPIFTTKISYQDRFPIVYWDKLWILTTKSNQPIQEITSIQTAWTLDVLNTNEELVARLENSEWWSGTWSTLLQLEELAKQWGKDCFTSWWFIICKSNDWRSQDPNCDISDIVIWSQIWAGCNSTLWIWHEYAVDTYCYDYKWVNLWVWWECWVWNYWDSNDKEIDYYNAYWNSVYGDKWVNNIWWKFYTWDSMDTNKDDNIDELDTNLVCWIWYHQPSDSDRYTLQSELGWTDLWWELHTNKTPLNNIIQALKIPLSGNLDWWRWGMAYLWSSNKTSTAHSSFRSFNYTHTWIGRSWVHKFNWYSVRCIKD